MKKTLLIYPLLLAFFSPLEAQNIGFVVEKQQVFLPDDSMISVADASSETSSFGFNVRVYGGAVQSLSAFEADLQFALEDRAPEESISSAISSFLLSGAVSWVGGPIEAAVFPFSFDEDWRGNRDLTADWTPVMLIVTNPIELVTDSDFIGLLAANFAVPSDGSIIGGISTGTGASRFDHAIFGVLNSPLTLESFPAIPEPRVYAAIFGLAALGLVAWRRRVRR